MNVSPPYFFDPAFIDDPYTRYADWRKQQPIWWDERSRAWVLSRYADTRAVLKDASRFSSTAMAQENPLPLLSDDPPRHTQLRRLVDRAFTVRNLRDIEDSVKDIAERMVMDLPGDEPVDIVQRLTIPLPVAVISKMMGIPAERGEDFKRWSDALTRTQADASPEERQADIAEMAEFFQDLIPKRRADPGADLVSAVVNAEVDGQRLSDADIVGFNILLLIAGNETTTNLLGNLLNVLVDRPDLYEALQSNPSLIEASIEEILRFDSPVQYLMRRALQDVEFYGQRVAAGEDVLIVTGSANRDADVYHAADEFRLDRPKTHHHAFGFGIHFCMGAPLARLEAKHVLRVLTARFSSLSRALGNNERTASHQLRGFHHFWLKGVLNNG